MKELLLRHHLFKKNDDLPDLREVGVSAILTSVVLVLAAQSACEVAVEASHCSLVELLTPSSVTDSVTDILVDGLQAPTFVAKCVVEFSENELQRFPCVTECVTKNMN